MHVILMLSCAEDLCCCTMHSPLVCSLFESQFFHLLLLAFSSKLLKTACEGKNMVSVHEKIKWQLLYVSFRFSVNEEKVNLPIHSPLSAHTCHWLTHPNIKTTVRPELVGWNRTNTCITTSTFSANWNCALKK